MSEVEGLPSKTTLIYLVIFSFIVAMIVAGAKQFSSLESNSIDWNAPLQCERVEIEKISAFHSDGALTLRNDVWMLKGSAPMHFNSVFVWLLMPDQPLPPFLSGGSRRKIEFAAMPYWHAYATSFRNQFAFYYLFHIPALISPEDQNIWYGHDCATRSSLFCQANRPLVVNGEFLCAGEGWTRDLKQEQQFVEGKRYLIVAFDNQEPIVQDRVIPFVRKCYYSDFQVKE